MRTTKLMDETTASTSLITSAEAVVQGVRNQVGAITVSMDTGTPNVEFHVQGAAVPGGPFHTLITIFRTGAGAGSFIDLPDASAQTSYAEVPIFPVMRVQKAVHTGTVANLKIFIRE